MTEDEAKKKWCPFIRHADDSGGSWNRYIEYDGTSTVGTNVCVASNCMAWRWRTISSNSGYCGLANTRNV